MTQSRLILLITLLGFTTAQFPLNALIPPIQNQKNNSEKVETSNAGTGSTTERDAEKTQLAERAALKKKKAEERKALILLACIIGVLSIPAMIYVVMPMSEYISEYIDSAMSSDTQTTTINIGTGLTQDRFEIIMPQHSGQGNPRLLGTIYAGTVPHEITSFVNMMVNSENYRRLGVTTPRGLLLYGPPGTGKTTVARGIAQSLNLPFISTSGASFRTQYHSGGADNLRELFRTAQNIRASSNNTHVIVFIDEIDSLARKRGGDRNHVDDNATLTELLRRMDGFTPNDGIIFIGATNRLSALDPAILRPGRFDRSVKIDLPNPAQRLAILRHHARSKVCHNGINFETLAERTEGWNAAEIAELLNEAGIRAGDLAAPSITQEHIDYAFDYRVNQRAEKAQEKHQSEEGSEEIKLNTDIFKELLNNKHNVTSETKIEAQENGNEKKESENHE